MSEASYSYFCFGGSFVRRLQPLLREKGTVSGELTGISPISEISKSIAEEDGRLTCWLPELDARLADCKADYFVMDLQIALQKLLVSGGRMVNATAENQALLTRKLLAVADPVQLPKKTVNAAMEGFANVVLKHFPARRIILIQTHNSPYWLAGNNLRSDGSPAVDANHAKWLAERERQFCQLTGCHLVDVTRFYFYQKEEGRPLTNAIYEKECYLDVAERIFDITRGGDGKAARPNFTYSVDRYAAYYYTMQRKPQRVFLDPEYFPDRLVLASGGRFVKTHREELIALDELDWSDPAKALAELTKCRPDSELTRVCNAFYAVLAGNYSDPGADYELMFRNEVVPEELLAYLKKEYAPKAKLLPNQITRYNAGYHFARMRRRNPAPYSTELTVEEPTVVDIFGSCICRTLFNVQENDFAVNNYWFHVPPFEFRNRPVEFEPDLFPEKPVWTDRLVRQQFECGVYQKIRDSKSKWLLVDLYSLVGPNNYYYDDCVFGDFDNKIAKKLKAKKISFMNGQNPIGSREQVIAALDPWISVVTKKYGKRIILVTGQRMDHWIGDDGKIYQVSKSAEGDDFLRRAEAYFMEKTGCYSVDIGGYFLPDELGLMRNTPSHKEDLCYIASHDIVRHIVDKMPKQKRFERCPGDVYMKHLIRLAKKNSPAVLEQALPLSELDKAVIMLGCDQMIKWQNELAKVYDRSEKQMSVEQVISRCGVSEELAAALRTAALTQFAPAPKFKTGYPKYPAGDGVISKVTADCTLPKFPDVKFKRIVNDKGEITVTWASPKAESVRVYRRSKATGWILLGRSGTESFVDCTIKPRTDYEYSLCAEVTQEDVTWLSSFTPVQKITSSVDVPVLVSAVNIAGRNTLQWMPVAGAECYRVYRKDDPDAQWEECGTVEAGVPACFSEMSKFPTGGEWYTVCAVSTVNGVPVAGGSQPGLQAIAL